MDILFQRLLAQGITLFNVVQTQTSQLVCLFLEHERKLIRNEIDTNGVQASEDDINVLLRENILNKKLNFGQTLLHHACIRGIPSIVSCLLKYGAHPNVYNDARETPLHLSAKLGHVVIMNLLYNAGADLSLLDNQVKIFEFTFILLFY